MKSLPTAPAPGTPVSSSLIRELIDAIRARTLLRGRGYRTRETPNGTFLDIDQPPQPKPAAKLPGCFEIRRPKANGEDDVGGFDNPYYMFGGRLYAAADLVNYNLSDAKNVIVALVVALADSSPSASIDTAESFAELQRIADDADTYVYPLYEFGPNGHVKCDLRNIPVMVGKEWMS